MGPCAGPWGGLSKNDSFKKRSQSPPAASTVRIMRDAEADSLLERKAKVPTGEQICTRGFAFGVLLSGSCTVAAATLLYQTRGGEGLANFLTSYLMELSLSMDNMFAFYLIFKFYKCPVECQSTALYWGMAGAVLLRATILGLGGAVILNAKPLMLIFAAVLLYSSYGMFGAGDDDDDDDDLSQNRVVRFVRWLRLPVSSEYHGTQFFTQEGGSLRATPLLLVILTIELSDIVFAVDSVPAVLGLSTDMLVAYVAVMCAVLGLRAIYTLSVVIIQKFRYLQQAVALLLAFVGCKIVLDILLGITIPTRVSLLVIVGTLAAGVLASCLCAGRTPMRVHGMDEEASSKR